MVQWSRDLSLETSTPARAEFALIVWFGVSHALVRRELRSILAKESFLLFRVNARFYPRMAEAGTAKVSIRLCLIFATILESPIHAVQPTGAANLPF